MSVPDTVVYVFVCVIETRPWPDGTCVSCYGYRTFLECCRAAEFAGRFITERFMSAVWKGLAKVRAQPCGSAVLRVQVHYLEAAGGTRRFPQ